MSRPRCSEEIEGWFTAGFALPELTEAQALLEQLGAYMYCTNCASDNPADAAFCEQCGYRLEWVCPACQAPASAGARFCKKCGASLDAASARAAPSATKSAVAEGIRLLAEQTSTNVGNGERKTVTALFADLKSSTTLMESLDPEEARAIVDPALRIMVEAVARYEGYVVQSTGDGIFALFGAPAAYEDHPQRGLYAALWMQQNLREYAQRLVNQGKPPLEARCGINTGEVVVRTVETGGKIEYTPIGITANVAARLQTVAPSGSVVVSEPTRRLVEGYFELHALGQMRVRGIGEPIAIYEVTGPGPLRTHFELAARRGLTQFVGRERELQQMQHALDLAMTGHGQLVAVMAEAGTGKSRLFYEFKAKLPPGCEVLEAYSVSHGKTSAWLPVLELLHGYVGIRDFDNPASRREKVRARITALDSALIDTLPYLWGLLEIQQSPDPLAQMDPRIRRQRTLDALKRIIVRESLNQPTIVIFEDLHWIDSETQALLDLLADSIAGAGLLLLVNYRPEYRHEWVSRTHYCQLRLDPLVGEHAAAMLDALLGNGAELDFLKRLVAERTGGNPFFVEEMVEALFEQGILARNGTIKLIRPLSQAHLPVTVQGVLAARIDRLPADDRDLLHTLAVLGHEFPLRLVERVAPAPAAELERRLAHLQASEFIYEQPAINDIEYVFKHALTQEVAYNSVLIERRKALHERTAAAIEVLYADRLDDHLSELARHYRHGVNTDKALRYAQLAAERALGRSAYLEVAGLIETALTLLDKLPAGDQRLRAELALRTIENTLSSVLHGLASQKREHAVRRVCELGKKLGERDQLLHGRIALAHLHFTRGESLLAYDLAKSNLDLAETTQDAGLLAEAHHYAGLLAFACGNLRPALAHLNDAQRHASAASLDDKVSPFSGGLYKSSFASMRALPLQLLGRPDEALKSAEQGLRAARGSRHLYSLSYALTAPGSQFRCYRREPESALLQAEEAIALSQQNGFSDWLNWGRFTHGWALAELGQSAQGIAEMEAAAAGFRHRAGQPFLQYRVALLAQAYARAGRTDQALTMLNEALAQIERSGERVDQAEILRLKGEVLLMHERSAAAEAEHCFRAGLAVARIQEAKWWELRTTVSLARLLRDTNRGDEARTLLGEIYTWFTEGFDTADLKDAKALLPTLSA